jgi:outer membrane immunogenic protein
MEEDFMHCKVLSAVLLASVGAGSAFAADLPVRSGGAAAAPVATPPAYLSDWTGFYLGVHGGGGGGHTSFDPGFFDAATPIFGPPSVSPSGGIVGGQAGYNWQYGPWVGGLEIDFSGADLNASSTFFQPSSPFPFTTQTKINELASARGRFGYLVLPSLWLFGTAGLGYGHSQFTTTTTTVATGLESSASDADEFGWVAGVGLEWKFWNHWLLRGEWLHYDFGRTSEVNEVLGMTATGITGININPRTTVDIGRAALSYKF